MFKSWIGYIVIAVCLCVSVNVCISNYSLTCFMCENCIWLLVDLFVSHHQYYKSVGMWVCI